MSNFKDFNLSKNTNTTEILINNIPVKVKQTISSQDKLDLYQVALQKATENGIFNEYKKEIFFHLNIIYLYTDIEFDDEDREDELELYDKLEQNDVIDKIIAAIPKEEYQELMDNYNELAWNIEGYRNTAAAVIQSIIQDLPANAAAAKDIVDSFDKSKYEEVVKFAEAANGGRNINPVTAP